MAPCAPLPDARYPGSQFFSVVPRRKALLPEVRRAPRFVPANVVPCIPRGKLPLERGRWV